MTDQPPADHSPEPEDPADPGAAGDHPSPETTREQSTVEDAPSRDPSSSAGPRRALDAMPLGPATPPPSATPLPSPALARRRGGWRAAWIERPETPIEVPRRRLETRSRRDFILFAAGLAASAIGGWWLLPDRTRARLAPGAARDRLDTFAARLGLSRESRERALDRALTFDDDVAEALYSKDRRVRIYDRSEATALPNNYDGQTPGPEYLTNWSLTVTGLASRAIERFPIDRLLRSFTLHDQVTRLVCVEGWSAIAWWKGIRFADFITAFPPAPGSRWAALRSSVNLDGAGRPDPYYVSIDLETARHPQSLLATHQGGRPLTVAHGAPLRLLAPMKLGLKNIKAVTEIAYQATEPPDYWNERGYSRYDGL